MNSKKIDDTAADHTEHVEDVYHTTDPAQERRDTYGKPGVRGVLSNKFVLAAATFATLGGTLFGYDQGVVSITLVMPQFLEQSPEVNTANSGASFKKGILTAMIELGAFLGAMNQGWIADKISRKWSILLAACIFLVGSALQVGSVNYDMLAAARFIGGIGVGMLSMVGPLYISEISPPEMRGTLLTLQELSIVFGIVVAYYITYGTRYIAGEWSWRLPFLLQMTPAIILALGVTFLPYSPRWLAQKGRNQQALATLSKLRQLPEDDHRVVQEWYDIRGEAAFHREHQAEKYPQLSDGSRKSRLMLEVNSWLDTWRGRGWRRTQVAVGLGFFQQFVGINALIYYSPTLFSTMGLDYEMQLTMSGVLNICQGIACLTSLFTLDLFGRRKILMAGATLMFLAQLVIAVLVGLYDGQFDSHPAAAWASVSMLLFYMLAFGASWGPIPWAMPPEVFPSSLRAKGCAQATMSNWINNFIIGLITPPMISGIGYGTYIFFAVFALISVLWVYFLVPETMGRTLEEMDFLFGDNQSAADEERKLRIKQDMMVIDSDA